MRVLLISGLYPAPGNPVFGAFVERQISALKALGVEIILVKNAAYYPAKQALLKKYGELAWRTLLNSRQGFDLVHVHFPTVPGLFGGCLARVRSRPLVVTLHGSEMRQWSRQDGLKSRLSRATVRWSLRQADGVIAVGNELAEFAKGQGVLASRIWVIDMGVDCSCFRPHPRDEVRRTLGLTPDAPVVVFVGTLTAVKGAEYFVHAAAALTERLPAARWYLVGGGPLEAELRQLVAQLAMADRITLVGQRPVGEVAQWDAAADVLVMPSLAEGFGLAAAEAMACGTPVVASRVGGLQHLVEDGAHGFLVPPADPEAIANRVYQLLTDTQLRARMGARGVEDARKHDVHRQARRVLDVYEQVVRPAG